MRTLLITLLLLTLTGCQALMSLTPEQVAIQAVMEQNRPDVQVDQQTIQVLQSQAWGEGRLVLVAYQQVERNRPRTQCLQMNEIDRPRGRWAAGNSSAGCTPIGGSPDPLDVGSGTSSGSDRPGLSYVSGNVNDPAIVAVEVVWADGEVQQVDVINSSYLAAREGVLSPVEVRGLDTDGNVIYSSQTGVPAPGKTP